jgi:hypothetical protein
MSSVSAPTTPIEPASIPGFRRMLHVLFRIGSAISRRLMEHSQAAVQAGTSWREATSAYQRVAQAIRRILMLALEIGEPGYGAAKDSEGEGAERPERLGGLDRPDWFDRPERRGRVADEEIRYDLTNKGMDGVIREICRDLGLPPLDASHPWTDLTVEQIAKLVLDAVALLLKQAARMTVNVAWPPGSPVPAGDAPGLAPCVPDG